MEDGTGKGGGVAGEQAGHLPDFASPGNSEMFLGLCFLIQGIRRSSLSPKEGTRGQ